MSTILIIYLIGFVWATIMNLHGWEITAWYWSVLFALIWPIDMFATWSMRRYYEDHTKL